MRSALLLRYLITESMFGVQYTGIAEFYIFPIEERVGLWLTLEWSGKRLSTNFKYLFLTVSANLLIVLRIEQQGRLCFLFRFAVVGIGL